MISWIYQNINHFTAPLGLLLGLCTAIYGFVAMNRRKQGKPVNVPRGVIAGLIVGLMLCAVLLGIALVHNFA